MTTIGRRPFFSLPFLVLLQALSSTSSSPSEFNQGAESVGYGINSHTGYGNSYGGSIGGNGLGLGFNHGLGYGGGLGFGHGSFGAGRIGYGSGLGRTGSYSSGGLGSGYGGIGLSGIVDLSGYEGGNIGYGVGGYGRIPALGYGGYGGGLEKTGFSKIGESLNDVGYQNDQSRKGETSSRLAEGVSKGQLAANDVKANTGFYNDAGGSKSGYADNKSYGGGNFYDQKGSKGAEEKAAAGHKKGHATNGFETSHHKDETGKTTTFYDEANDEGDHYNFGGNQGAFGDRGSNYYQGGYQDDKYNEGERARKGNYDKGISSGKENADKLAYGNQVFYGNNGQYAESGGNDRQSVLGHSEASKFYKHHPSYY